jgi:PIN domain nuclease of toxin-antitoxin system
VNGYLLDTNAVLLAMAYPELLSEAARKAILAGPNVLSVVSYWSVLLKSAHRKLDVGDPQAWWADALEQMAATALVLRPQHIAEAYRLQPLHNEPFDRMLIAQARVEGLTVVTTDVMMARYASVGLRAVE